jgi:hypothetical protein
MPGELDALIEEARRKWSAFGIKLLPGATASALADFEQRHGLRLPADLRTWFCAVGGTDDMDEGLIRFWKLDEVVPDERSPEFFVFADFLIESHAYAFRISEQGTSVAVLYGVMPVPIASTFESFLRLYLREPPVSSSSALFPPLP